MAPRPLDAEETRVLLSVKTRIVNKQREDYSMARLCKLAGMPAQRVKDGFYQLFGMSPARYVYMTRMYTALFLLRHTDKPIKEISIITGYRSTQNFARALRRHFGCTAQVLRDGFT